MDDNEDSTVPLFPQERAFIVRFDRNTNLAAGICVGKVESVVTSRRHSFEDLDQLLDHLRRLLE